MIADVSAVIPCYGERRSLVAAIASALRNDVREVVVVDDASPQPIPVSSDERVRILRHTVNAGAAAARNTGVRQAIGRYVAFLDSDDVWCPGKIAAQLQRITAGDGARAASTGFRFWRGDQGHAFRPPPSAIGHREALTGGRFGLGSTLLLEREAFLASGGFDTGFRRNEDWDWLLRYTRRAAIGTVPDLLADVHLSGRPSAAPVHRSLDRIRTDHLTERLRPAERRVLQAALHWERGAAFGWEERFASAALELARCFAVRPVWTARAVLGRMRGRIA